MLMNEITIDYHWIITLDFVRYLNTIRNPKTDLSQTDFCDAVDYKSINDKMT